MPLLHRLVRPAARLKRAAVAARDFLHNRILRHLPTLTPAEKTALAALAVVLATGAALRAWERSGVRIGPVDDWESLRALLIGARAEHAAAGGGEYACADDAPEARFDGGSGADRMAGRPLLAAGAGVAGGKSKAGRTDQAKADAKKTAPSRPVDLNTAGEKALLGLPGVGPSTVKAILARRAARGPFRAVEELMEVKGIGRKKFEALKPFVHVARPAGNDDSLPHPDGPAMKTASEPAAPGGDL